MVQEDDHYHLSGGREYRQSILPCVVGEVTGVAGRGKSSAAPNNVPLTVQGHWTLQNSEVQWT